MGKPIVELLGWCLEAGGPFGLVLRRQLREKKYLERWQDDVFPLPGLGRGTVLEPHPAAELVDDVRAWVQLIIAALNLMHSGAGDSATCYVKPSPAHDRVHAGLWRSVVSFLAEAGPWPKET